MNITNPKYPGISVETGYDNANPQDAGMVRVDEDGVYAVRQFLEDNAPAGYSFHLNLALNNSGAKPAKVPLRIFWAESNYDYCRDYMYIGYDAGQAWRMLATQAAQGVTEMQIVVPPGRHLLCCHPKFDVGDYLALLDRFGGTAPFERIVAARSAENRVIACLRCGNPAGRKLVVTTRAHGYETAGAYCLAGWFAYAAAQPDRVAEIMNQLNLYFFPMINVDAVAHGNCCLAPTGVNFGRELAVRGGEDAGARGLVDFIDGLQPEFYLDMHNNTGPHLSDAFRSDDAGLLAAFAARAPDRSRDQKVWGAGQVKWDEGSILTACRRQFNTLPMLTEFPWYARAPGDMAEHGREFFNTLLPLLADWQV